MKTVTLLFLLIAMGLPAQSSPADADLKVLVRDAVGFLQQGKNRSEDYACTLHNSRKEFDAEGKTRSEQTTVWRKTFRDGYMVQEMLERNGKPLTAVEKEQQEAKLNKYLGELKSLSPGEREKRRKKAAENDEWVRELPEALQFSRAGEEILDKRRVLVLNAEPRPGYEAKSMRAKVFEKLKAKLWIDLADRELVKAEGETFDSISVGFGVLGRVEKGTRFHIHRTRLPDANWVVDSQRIRFGARIMLVKWMSAEAISDASDFRHKSQLNASR